MKKNLGLTSILIITICNTFTAFNYDNTSVFNLSLLTQLNSAQAENNNDANYLTSIYRSGTHSVILDLGNGETCSYTYSFEGMSCQGSGPISCTPGFTSYPISTDCPG